MDIGSDHGERQESRILLAKLAFYMLAEMIRP
jgi:hypothetical protein